MKIYHYARDGGYLGESEARRDPKKPNGFLLPANATFQRPPNPGKDQNLKFVDGEWTLVPDYSGNRYWHKQTMQMKRFTCGLVPDLENYTEVEPVGDVDTFDGKKWILSQETKNSRRLAAAKQYLNDTNWYVIRSVDPDRGDPIPDDVREKRRVALEVIHEIETCEATTIKEG
jgi:hypothetical protein